MLKPWPSAAVLLLAADVCALPPTTITATDCCSGAACAPGVALDFPASTYPNTPRFDFTITATLPAGAAAPTFRGHGSLGLPKHPLGVFKFDNTGPACGTQKMWVKDGVLAVITVDFPPCPWAGTVKVAGHVDVWTTIPAVGITPGIGVSTGFTVTIEVFPGGGVGSGNNTCMKQMLADCGSSTTGKDCMECVKSGSPKHKKDMKAAGCTRQDWKAFCDTFDPTPAPPAPPPPQLLCALVRLAQPLGNGADPAQDSCTLDTAAPPAYPPPSPPGGEIPWETIDLSADPLTRWDHVVTPRATEIAEMIEIFIASFGGKNGTVLRAILGLGSDVLLKKLPDTYADELRGINKATGINIGYLFIYNIMYEIMGLCTSIVSQDAQGHVYHTRNLDFGLFIGTDPATHNWALTPKLRPLLFNARFMKDGVNVYNSTAYAGYVGLLTGMKTGGFSVSVDTRFDANIDRYLLGWIRGKYDGQFLSFKTRDMMEHMSTFDDAVYELSNYLPMGPAYIIVGGAKSGEGAVITVQAGSRVPKEVRTLKDALANGGFYVLETNYDGSAPPPAFDDRRYPAQDCLNKLGSKQVSWANLFGVHSSNPTKNALTTYTTLMSAETGHFEAYKQFCAPGPDCAPF